MKTLLILALGAFFAVMPQGMKRPTPDDWKVISDKTENGIRNIVATPSPMVCSKVINIKVAVPSNEIQSVVYTGGCNGNLQAVDRLLKGMSVAEAVSRLDGIDCAGRGTSCTDQLARILKHCFNIK